MTAYSVDSFIAHLVKAGAQALNQHIALEAAAKLVEETAKGLIGDDAVGPEGNLPAWAPLAPSTIEEKSRLGYSVPDPLLRTGELRGSIKHVALIDEALVYSDSEVAVWQELGTVHIPPRSFLQRAALMERDRVETMLGRAVLISMV